MRCKFSVSNIDALKLTTPWIQFPVYGLLDFESPAILAQRCTLLDVLYLRKQNTSVHLRQTNRNRFH